MAENSHYVAVIGGAVSGSETAFQFAEQGIRVAVFEQNALPYGKIEDGLPKWHVKLRDKEEGKINDKMNHERVRYIPNVVVGKDVLISDLLNDWGFSSVVLANGAWKDRPLPIEGIDEYIGKGLYYQNPFIYCYNHHHEPNYDGDVYEYPDGAVVIGGGLASLDVAKVLMFKNVEKALQEKGHKVNLFALDRSIAKVLDGLDLSLADLGIKGCTLYYRRRVKDMPLTPMATDTPEKLEKAERIREKVFGNYQDKYLFNLNAQHTPVDKIVVDGRLAGLVFKETEIVNGRAKAIEGTEKEVYAPVFISSIGSIPMPMEGLQMQGSVYHVDEDQCCKVEGYDHVYAVGNAVTGRGNIIESMKHARSTSKEILEAWGYQVEKIAVEVESITAKLPKALSEHIIHAIDDKISTLQRQNGYDGNYDQWVEKHLPVRLESLIDTSH